MKLFDDTWDGGDCNCLSVGQAWEDRSDSSAGHDMHGKVLLLVCASPFVCVRLSGCDGENCGDDVFHGVPRLWIMEPQHGFEPATCRIQGGCYAN